MHWTIRAWECPGCGVAVGHSHDSRCAALNVGQSVVWLGPPLVPGMIPKLVHEGDPMAGLIACQHCEEPFVAGEVMFENRSQSVGIHAGCVLLLAAMVPHGMTSPAEVEAEFERRRAEIAEEA